MVYPVSFPILVALVAIVSSVEGFTPQTFVAVRRSQVTIFRAAETDVEALRAAAAKAREEAMQLEQVC